MDTIEERKRERAGWTDERLTSDLGKAAANERCALVELLLDLPEFEKRSLSEKSAYSSLFDYCTRKLGYSSSEAGRRIAVARKAEKLPLLLEMIERGELHLSGAGLLAGLLTSENHEEVLRRAKGRSQDEIARIVAALAPQSVPKDSVRVLRAPLEAAGLAASPPTPPPAPASVVGTVAPAPSADLFGDPCELQLPEAEAELYAITFSASKETRDMLERAKEVLRHRFPRARTDEIVNLALKKLLAEVDRDLRKPPKPAKLHVEGAAISRYIPEAVKQEAWERDGGQCAFVGPDGTRCTARAWLEFDHCLPYALGGSSRDSANIRPYCRPHNAWAGNQAFGRSRAGP